MLAILQSYNTRIVLSILATSLVAWLLYPQSLTNSGNEKSEIVYWIIPLPGIVEAQQTLIKEFERQNPEYSVKLSFPMARDLTGDSTRFLLSIAGDVPPDVIFFDRFAVAELASRGAFLSINTFLEKDRVLEDGIKKENFYAPLWEETELNGNSYGVPNFTDNRSLYYQKPQLLRAGFEYQADDPEVIAGKAKTGDAKPPRTWEEISNKKAHYDGFVHKDGLIEITRFTSRPGINLKVTSDVTPHLAEQEIQSGDVAVILKNQKVFRARIAKTMSPLRFTLDFTREHLADLSSIPSDFLGDAEIKIFDQNDMTNRLVRFHPNSGNLAQIAFLPLFGNDFLYFYGWLNGGSFLDQASQEILCHTPQIVEALQWMVDISDCLGGYEATAVFRAQAQENGQLIHPYLTGNLIMTLETDQLIKDLLEDAPSIDYGVMQAPVPASRYSPSNKPVSWAGGFCYSIPSNAPNPEGSWKLIRWLSSIEGNRLYLETIKQIEMSKGLSGLVRLSADKRINTHIREHYLPSLKRVTPAILEHYDFIFEQMHHSRHRPVTPVGQQYWNELYDASENAMNHVTTVDDALQHARHYTQRALDRINTPLQGTPINWSIILKCYTSVFALLFIGITIVQLFNKKHSNPMHNWYDGYLAASPWFLGLIFFGVGPMLFTAIISLSEFDILSPARFVGLSNFHELFGQHFDANENKWQWNDPLFWRSITNTLFMLIEIPLSIVLGLGIAMLLNRKIKGLSLFRTFFYLPTIIPAVASFILWLWLFDPNLGGLNQFLRYIGITHPPSWLSDPAFSKPSLILMNLWAVGGSMLIWLAGLRDIPEDLYEAAKIDGANRWYQFTHITLPLLTPYIFFNSIMGMIGVFQTFESAYIMTNGGPASSTYFYAYKLFNEAFRYLNMGTASAMVLLMFTSILIITVIQLKLSKHWVHYRTE